MCLLLIGKFTERVGELKPASVAKRFKVADEEDDDEDDLETEDKEQTLMGLDEGSVAAKPKATTLIDEEKVAELKANKSLSERQREFKDMLLERGVRSTYCIHSWNEFVLHSNVYRYLHFQLGKRSYQSLYLIPDVNC